MKINKGQAIFFLCLAAFIWGTAFSAQKIATQSGVGTFYFNGARFLIGAISLIPVVAIFSRGRISFSKTLFPSLISGAVLFCAANLQQLGIAVGQSAGKASFITGLYIILVPIASFLLFRKKPHLFVAVGALVAAFGLYFISIKPGEGMGAGDGYLLIACLFWTAHILVVDRLAADCDPLFFSLLQFFFCGVFSLLCAFIFEDVSLAALGGCLGPLLYTGILSSGIAYTCQVIGQRGLEPSRASLILSGEALFGALSGIVVNREIPTDARVVVGMVLIFAGILLAQIEPKRVRKRTKEG